MDTKATSSIGEPNNEAKVLAGFKGGASEMFANPVMLPPLQFKQGVPAEVRAAQTAGPEAPRIPTVDQWKSR